MRENQFPALYADVEAEPLSWGDVLGAYDEEQAAQREYEALVLSAIAAQVPGGADEPALMRRKAAARRSGACIGCGNAAAAAQRNRTPWQRRSPLILPPSGLGLPRPTLCPAP